MTLSRFIGSLAVSLLLTISLFAQRSGQQDVTRADVYINVSYDNDDRALPQMYRVQLFTNGRMPISEQLTNDRGQVVFHSVGQGTYMVSVAGQDVETSELSFAVSQHESTHIEFIRLKRKAIAGQASSNQGTVTAAALNIPDKARKEFDKGLAAFDKQDFPVARERFSKAADIYPQYSFAFLNLGVIAMKEGDSAQGQRYFEKAIAVDPQNPAAYTYLGRVLIMNEKYTEAEQLFTKALSITPLDPEPLTMLATSQLRSGKLQLAVANAKKVHTFPHQHYAISHLVAAEALMQEDQPDEAADEYRLLLKEEPNGPNASAARAALQTIEQRVK